MTGVHPLSGTTFPGHSALTILIYTSVYTLSTSLLQWERFDKISSSGHETGVKQDLNGGSSGTTAVSGAVDTRLATHYASA